MASTSSSDDGHFVILVCSNPGEDQLETESSHGELLLSTDDLRSWEPSALLHHRTVRIKADRRRLIEESSYFDGLLGGSFSESRQGHISIEWSLESFIGALKYVFGCPLDISAKTLLPLLEGSLYFGIWALLAKCENWCSEVASSKETGLHQMQLDDLIRIWKFCSQHALHFLGEIFSSCLARNFMYAASSQYFVDIPYTMLVSCLEHPQLTLDSEMHLAEALLVWIDYNLRQVEHAGGYEYEVTDVLKHIRVSLLPLSFAAGKRRSGYFSDLADKCIQSIRSLKNPSVVLKDLLRNGDSSHLRLRLTEYTEMVDLSGCPQMTSTILLLSMLPYSYSMDPLLRNSLRESLLKLEGVDKDRSLVSQQVLPVLCFEAVQKVDISKCLGLNIIAAMECFSKSFPSLRVLKAAYLSNLKASDLLQLLKKCPLLSEVDLTHDINPIPLAQVSDTCPSSAINPTPLNNISNFRYGYLDMTSLNHSRFLASTIARLTLEGRSDVCDSDLLYIATNCVSLCYLNLKGCTSVTDTAISDLLLRSLNLHSLIVSDTSFGNKSVVTLCSGGREMAGTLPYPPSGKENSDLLAHQLQIFHMGGCKGVDPTFLLQLVSCIKSVKSLCLRDTQLDDHALSGFPGSSLDLLDVSNTMISQSHLVCVIRKNPGLKILKARGCKNIVQADGNCERKLVPPSLHCGEMYFGLGNSCKLKELSLGWGFSSSALVALKPAITALSSLTVGLGGSLGEDALRLLPTICPMLESLTLYFQVLSDGIMSDIRTSLRHLKVLELCYCLGDISILSFKFLMPQLRKLRLQRVAAWMTHDDLLVLAQNCPNLTELCLVGCKRLSSDFFLFLLYEENHSEGHQGVADRFIQSCISTVDMLYALQAIALCFHSCICYYKSLIYLHLEDCGEVTGHGVSSLFDCVALEVFFLRHNGPGIQKSFILDAVSELPMLRQLSLDTCDAREGSFDIPKCEERHSISAIKISRCKLQIRSLDIQFVKPRRRPVHWDTLLLLRNCRDLTRTVVKERL
ncbi:BTB/POZ domain-containing protein FBL11-like isoform X2 [Punica granatum]|uniref:BTB/POZ domain-containing protein FBL11-like isoform X2 n=1 Tax=Punica granatum TaxID=22663 RepID=A0A6P8CM79_PUNGR|nr:BTB/POZ domain-containing protein FBL11-like isoform X2 [Punica granatum]